jgi:hypothetical protein
LQDHSEKSVKNQPGCQTQNQPRITRVFQPAAATRLTARGVGLHQTNDFMRARPFADHGEMQSEDDDAGGEHKHSKKRQSGGALAPKPKEGRTRPTNNQLL